MSEGTVIVFENLRQRTSVVGQYDAVKAQVKSFVASNAKGFLRDVDGHKDVQSLAIDAAKQTKALMAS